MFRVLSACVLAWAGLAAARHAQTLGVDQPAKDTL